MNHYLLLIFFKLFEYGTSMVHYSLYLFNPNKFNPLFSIRWHNNVAYKRQSLNYVFILANCIHASTAQNHLFEKIICCVTSEKYTNGYCDWSVKNVKKNLKESRILKDINAPAAFAIGVIFNSSLPRRKKVMYVNQLRKKLES